jgi:hypothetical protein
MTDTSPENVARMLDGVTPGPWKCCETTIHGIKYGGCWVEGPAVDEGDGMPRGLPIPISGSGGAMSYTTRLVDIQVHDHTDANARFIAYAREALPALAAERDALAEDVSTYQRMVLDMTAENEALDARLAEVEAERDLFRVREELRDLLWPPDTALEGDKS